MAVINPATLLEVGKLIICEPNTIRLVGSIMVRLDKRQ